MNATELLSSHRNDRARARTSVLAAGTLVLCLASVAAHGQAFDVRTFRPWSGYAIPNGVWLTLDFDGDGRSDIVHAVQGSSYVHSWRSRGDGNFDVGTFSPWPGYAIPNGIWLTGDFNADGLGDIVHAVQNSDYVHIWTSQGNGTFAVGTFSPWRGYAIPNGEWLTGDFNADGRTDLFHAVANTDYAHYWLSTGTNQFDVQTFRPWAGYAIPNGLWRAGDFNGDGRTDIFHAVQGSDYAHVWRATATLPTNPFVVDTVRPWAGYAVPNGLWIPGDYDGDGRTDMLHAVQSGDYVHVWTPSATGTWSFSTFRPWAGYAIPNGIWVAGDFNADGRHDIVHAVQNTSYTHVWLSQGAGSFNVSTFSPWAGYAIPNGLWLPMDLNNDGRSDIVHAVQSGDYVHPWMSGLPGPGQVAIEGIEVSQAVQNMAHNVTLVANKNTWARAYLGTTNATPLAVTGTITVRNVGTGATTTVTATAAITVSPAQNGQVRAKRENLAASLNFPLPAAFTAAGQYSVTLTSVTASPGGGTVTCSNCAISARNVTMATSAPLRLRVLGLRYTTGTPPTTFAPANADFNLVLSWLRRAYPVPQVISTTATVNATATWPFTCNDANAQLAAARTTDIAGGTDNRTHYLGLVANGGGYMRGCASGIPTTPDPATVASGPTGPTAGGLVPVNATGDNDASFGDWYGGHELGHTFGRFHPGFCNGNSSDDASFPYPNGQISDNAGTFTGLDVGDAGNAITAAALPGAARFDIMTYCNQPQWPSAYMYAGVRSRLMSENPAASGPGPGGGAGAAAAADASSDQVHERRAFCPCNVDVQPALKGPPPIKIGREVPIAIASAREPRRIPNPRGKQPRVPDATLAMQPTVPKPSLAVQPVVDFLHVVVPEVEEPPLEPPAVEVRDGRYVSVIAVVNLSANTGEFRHVQQVQRASVRIKPAGESRASLRILDGAGRVIATQPVLLRFDSDRDAKDPLMALVDEVIVERENIGALELLLGKAVVARRRVSKNAPIVAQVRLERGELAWTATDPDGDKLTFTVQASSDGEVWTTIAIGVPQARYTLEGNQEEARQRPRMLRVIANDGYWNSAPAVYRSEAAAQ